MAYQGAVRAALQVELAEQQAAQPHQLPQDAVPAVPGQEGVPRDALQSPTIASERLPTYSGQALASMTDDGGMGFPGIEYDGG